MENLDLIEIYNKFLQFFPLTSYKEVLESGGDSIDLSPDQITLLKDIEKWILDVFELIVNNLEFLEF